jgi:hypothetical protein
MTDAHEASPIGHIGNGILLDLLVAEEDLEMRKHIVAELKLRAATQAPDYSEWAPLSNDELIERMQANEADLLEILLRWGNDQTKAKDSHELLAKQYARMAEHHQYLMEVRKPKPEADVPL